MVKFQFRGKEFKGGNLVEGEIEAESREEARAQLARRGLFAQVLTEVRPSRPAPNTPPPPAPTQIRPWRARALLSFLFAGLLLLIIAVPLAWLRWGSPPILPDAKDPWVRLPSQCGWKVSAGSLVRWWILESKDPIESVATKYQGLIGRDKQWFGGFSAEEKSATWSRGEVVFDSGHLSLDPKDPRKPSGLVWLYQRNGKTYAYLADCKPLAWARAPRLNLPPALELALRDPEAAKDLKLANSGLKSLPAEVLQLIRLNKLDISGNEMVDLPQGTARLTGLQILWMDGNPLRKLPTVLTQLGEINSLKAINCQLQELPNELPRLAKLSFLSLDQNPLKKFPPVLLKLEHLHYLCIADAQIDSLPPGLKAMHSLQYLDIRRNHITALPPDLGEMPSLGCIRLGGNPIPPDQIAWLRKALPKCQVDDNATPDI